MTAETGSGTRRLPNPDLEDVVLFDCYNQVSRFEDFIKQTSVQRFDGVHVDNADRYAVIRQQFRCSTASLTTDPVATNVTSGLHSA